MAITSGATGNRQSTKDKERAKRLKTLGITRTTGRCSVCYRIVATDSWKSRYTHLCWSKRA